mgnify:CR=1 FL=1
MKKKTLLILSLILLGIFLLYWFQIRQSEIRSYCDKVAWNNANPGGYEHLGKSSQERYDWKYTQCLHSQGLK